MTTDTVLVTGSNGNVGTAVVEDLLAQGYRTVGLDQAREPAGDPDEYWTADLLDYGEVRAALDDVAPDAVIHLGTAPSPRGLPNHTTYESNVVTTYHVLEAAAAEGVECVAIASSLNVMGAIFQDAPIEVEYLPVDEDHPLTPRDAYALGKRTIELQADGFARRRGPPTKIATLRLPLVASETVMRDQFAARDRTLEAIDDDSWAVREELFSYVARPDAARAFRRALEADFSGYESLFVSAADTTMDTPSPRIVAESYPDATDRGVDGHETLIDTTRAERVLDWTPERSWREYRAGPTPARSADREPELEAESPADETKQPSGQ